MCNNSKGTTLFKTILLASFLALSVPVHSEPLLINEPVVLILKSEFDAFMAEVKKLADEYKALETAKSCKKT